MRDRRTDTHRKVAAAKAGRKLSMNEIVHHRDEDKANNSPTNLEVQPRADHTTAHNRQRPLSQLRKALRMTKEGRKLY